MKCTDSCKIGANKTVINLRQPDAAVDFFLNAVIIQLRPLIIYPAIINPIADMASNPGIFAACSSLPCVVFSILAVWTGETGVFSTFNGAVCGADNFVSSL